LRTLRSDDVLGVDDRKPRACPSLYITEGYVKLRRAGCAPPSVRQVRRRARGAARTVPPAPAVSDDANEASVTSAGDTVLGCWP
jgi:hypothetical protein